MILAERFLQKSIISSPPIVEIEFGFEIMDLQCTEDSEFLESSDTLSEKVPLRRAIYVTLSQLAGFYHIDSSECIVTKPESNDTVGSDKENDSERDQTASGFSTTSVATEEMSAVSADILPEPNDGRCPQYRNPENENLIGTSLRATTKKIFPPSGGHNLCLLVIDLTVVVDKLRVDGSRVRLAEALLGDETGTVAFRARDEQIELLQDLIDSSKQQVDERPAVVLRNCTVELYQNKHLRLAVTKWGKLCPRSQDQLSSTPSPPISANMSLNFSLADLSSRSILNQAHEDFSGTSKMKNSNATFTSTHAVRYNAANMMKNNLDQVSMSPHNPGYFHYSQVPMYPWAPGVAGDGYFVPHSPFSNQQFSWKHQYIHRDGSISIPLPYDTSPLEVSASQVSIKSQPKDLKMHVAKNESQIGSKNGNKGRKESDDKFAQYHHIGSSHLSYYQMLQQQYGHPYNHSCHQIPPYYGMHAQQSASVAQKLMHPALDMFSSNTAYYMRGNGRDCSTMNEQNRIFTTNQVEMTADSPHHLISQQHYSVPMQTMQAPYFASPSQASHRRAAAHPAMVPNHGSDRSIGTTIWMGDPRQSFSELPTAVSLAVFGGGSLADTSTNISISESANYGTQDQFSGQVYINEYQSTAESSGYSEGSPEFTEAIVNETEKPMQTQG